MPASAVTPVAPGASVSTAEPTGICAHDLPPDVASFLQWAYDLLHYAVCPECASRLGRPPAPTTCAAEVLVEVAAHPHYQIAVRRLGGFMAPPTLLHSELESLEALRQAREEAQAARLRAFLMAQRTVLAGSLAYERHVREQEATDPGVNPPESA